MCVWPWSAPHLCLLAHIIHGSNNNSDGNMRIAAVPHGPPSNVWMDAGHTADDVDTMTMTR